MNQDNQEVEKRLQALSDAYYATKNPEPKTVEKETLEVRFRERYLPVGMVPPK